MRQEPPNLTRLFIESERNQYTLRDCFLLRVDVIYLGWYLPRFCRTHCFHLLPSTYKQYTPKKLWKICMTLSCCISMEKVIVIVSAATTLYLTSRMRFTCFSSNLYGCITDCYDIHKRWYVSTTVFIIFKYTLDYMFRPFKWSSSGPS